MLKKIRHMMLAITGVIVIFSTGVQAKDEKMTIGAIYLDTQGYYAGVRWGVQDSADKAGGKIGIIETNAQGDVSKESSFIDTMIARDVSAVVLSAVSTNGSVRAIKRANEANIPVICYNTCINEKGVDKYVYAYLVGDPYEFGKKLGNSAADYFIEKKITQPTIAVINCEAFEVCVQRRKGFEDALKAKVSGMKIVANQEGTVLDKAISVGEKLLISSGKVDAIFGESGGATLGAVKAVRNQNKVGQTVVFGSDMTTEIAQELANRQVLQAVVDISGKKMGALAFAQVMSAINRQPVAQKVVQVPIDLYATTQSATDWLATHKDGLP
ncbi:substrate-binding domain-containing protein [Serratia proteamaculans]|uniref:substrate-binding domain-containing protein n=1 Tax=Serratia proteamaculans TaxID=28151 RepID=UPI00396574D6